MTNFLRRHSAQENYCALMKGFPMAVAVSDSRHTNPPKDNTSAPKKEFDKKLTKAQQQPNTGSSISDGGLNGANGTNNSQGGNQTVSGNNGTGSAGDSTVSGVAITHTAQGVQTVIDPGSQIDRLNSDGDRVVMAMSRSVLV